MMYEFIDTNEQHGQYPLPAEALQINGLYIENVIEGYRTLSVQGREALSAEVSTESAGLRTGSVYISRKYPERVLSIRYQLICATNEAFRQAYNRLAEILNVEESKLIFNDEPDKFFIGVPGELDNVEPGKNSIISEFKIICPDPHKYSVEEYEAEILEDGTLFCNYGGTFPAHPKFSVQFLQEGNTTEEGEESTITGSGECGFVSFFDGEEHVLQFGDPEEVDGEELEATQTLLSANLNTSNAWTSAVSDLWKTNDANAVVPTGSVKSGTAGMVPYTSGAYFTGATSYGTGEKYHGPSISAVIPADKSGVSGAENFMFEYSTKCCIGKSADDQKRVGGLVCYLSDADGNKVAGVRIYKNKTGSTGYISFIADGSNRETVEIDLSFNNEYFGNNRGESYKTVGGKQVLVPAIVTNKTVRITKTGNELVINAGGITRTYTVENPGAVTRVTFQFQAYGTRTPLTFAGIYKWKFDKLFCDTWKEVPNKFTAGDLLEINGNDGEVLLNGLSTPGLGALGNNWEDFVLLPGENQIGWAFSEWCQTAPEVGMTYREVFL